MVSRRKQPKALHGWMYGIGSVFHTDSLDPLAVTTTELLVDGTELRTAVPDALAGERAEYFFERFLMWGYVVYVEPASVSRAAIDVNVRLGTLDRSEVVTEEGPTSAMEFELWSPENHEKWGRILQDEVLTAYIEPDYVVQGAFIAVDDSPVGTGRKRFWPSQYPHRFMWDIRQRFSLQREEDELRIALGSNPQSFNDTQEFALIYQWKALVKEYRK